MSLWITIFIILIRTILCVQLAIFARQRKMANLSWLAIFYFAYILVDLASLGMLINPEDRRYVATQPIVMAFSYLPLAVFVWQTFYQHKKLGPVIITGLTGLFSLITLIFGLQSIDNQANTDLIMAYSFSGILPLVLWGWHGIAAMNSYKVVKKDKTVEDWVKLRYSAMIWYSVLQFAAAIIGSMASVPSLINFSIHTGSVVALLAILLQACVWLMPEGLRHYANRNYVPPLVPKELSEEELMRLLGEQKAG